MYSTLKPVTAGQLSCCSLSISCQIAVDFGDVRYWETIRVSLDLGETWGMLNKENGSSLKL